MYLKENKDFLVKLVLLIISFVGCSQAAKHNDKYVTLVTNKGEITLELFWSLTPKTCKNFAELAKKKYYDNTIFHRVIDNFMIQGGDPTGTGRGGKSIYGKKFEDEFNANLKHDSEGILSMANAGPDTNGSQFFITLKKTSFLNGKHTVFGKVVKGMDVVHAIGKVETNDDKPIDPITILKAKVHNDLK
ncbi:peptidyl-prolyl cis-trans isomerase cypE-like [Oppia nitens]|uniref:peptidyl-prolyl cis-trans isomerase cypE-like n=1 Tax=Oppia nitens TaxID=1686743 RepID=UPI0023DCAAD2|nr:peptidyl-prolyl cis-trans isomerase cypE-like [Oppia nitens]